MNYTDELQKVMGFTNYRGCLIEQRADGFYLWNIKRGDTMEQARKAVDQAFVDMQNSFSKPVDTSRSNFDKKGMLCK